MLTDGKSRNTNALWNKKGDKIAFATTKRTGKDLDFYIAPLSNPSEAKLVKEIYIILISLGKKCRQ